MLLAAVAIWFVGPGAYRANLEAIQEGRVAPILGVIAFGLALLS